MGPKPGRPEPVEARPCLRPPGFWEELPTSLPVGRREGRGAVCGLHRTMAAVCGAGEHDSAGTQSWRVPGDLLCHPVSFKVTK